MGKLDARVDALGTSKDAAGDAATGLNSPYVSIPLTGCPGDYYYVPVTIGGQVFQMQLDTGSTDTAIAASSCTTCGVSPEYAPPAGSCSGTTSALFGFGDGGVGWNADICTATVAVGEEAPAVTMKVAAITDQEGQFFNHYDCLQNALPGPSQYQGIFGLGPIDLDTIGTNAEDAYENELVARGVPDAFALLLCSTGGILWFGGYDAHYAPGTPQYTPLSGTSYWDVGLSSVGLGGVNLGGGDPSVLVDTGTQGFYMPTAAYNTLMSTENAGFTSMFGSSTLNSIFAESDCVAPSAGQTEAEIDAALPKMTLTFPSVGGGAFTLSMAATVSYLGPVTSSNGTVYCLYVGPNSLTGGTTTMGGTILRGNVTIFDEANGRLGFVPESYCE